MDLRLSSYNCRSVKQNIQSVRELCSSSDIICLQETWLPVQEQNFLANVDSMFSFYGKSPVDLSQSLLYGRPFGGVAFLYNKTLSNVITRIETNDDRLICIDIDINGNVIRLINCYLPYDNGTNDADYINYLAKIHELMDSHPNNNVLAVGDFNAHPQSRFGNELHGFCRDYGYVISDLHKLPEDTYTWVSDATGHTRWLDHLLCPASLLPNLRNMFINHNIIGSDHLPISVCTTYTQIPSLVPCSEENSISYTVRNKDQYYGKTEVNLKNITLPLEALHCNYSYCRNNSHKRDILKFYKDTVSALLISGDVIHSQGNNDYNIIPGWNELVSDQHREARETYLEWRNHGKPRFGQIYWQMTRSRLIFKRAFKTCRKLND